MIGHDHPRFSDPEFHPNIGGFACEEMPYQRCIGCGDSTPMNELDRGYCPVCRENCAHCGDWMAGENEMELMGKRVHERCYDDARAGVA